MSVCTLFIRPVFSCVVANTAIVQPLLSLTALSSCILHHQSTSSQRFKTPKSLNSSSSFSLRIFSSWLLRFLSCPCTVTPAAIDILSLSCCHCFSLCLYSPSTTSPRLVLRHWSPFVRSAEASSQESNCSNKSREALRCILSAPCREVSNREPWSQRHLNIVKQGEQNENEKVYERRRQILNATTSNIHFCFPHIMMTPAFALSHYCRVSVWHCKSLWLSSESDTLTQEFCAPVSTRGRAFSRDRTGSTGDLRQFPLPQPCFLVN